MGLFIRLLLIVLTVKSQAELVVAFSGNQRTVSCELDISSKIDELKNIVENYLNMVHIELINTKDQVKELKVAMTDNQETVSSELEDTRRKIDELQVAVSGNQETVSSKLVDTIRKTDELQVTVSGIQETVSSEIRGMKRQLEELPQVSVSALLRPVPKDCSDILARGVSMSGMYTVQPLDSGEAFQVYCDMETDGGGWTVFQRRQDGSVDFYLDFASYSRGFGNLEGEFWLGNDNLHRLTAQGNYTLRVDLASFDDDTAYAVYDSFNIADVSDNYRLTLGSYSGTAGDTLRDYNINNQAFSTMDMDNDESSLNCAVDRRGAWWYRRCTDVNLNGLYLGEGVSSKQGVFWYGWKRHYSLKYTDMKLRLNS